MWSVVVAPQNLMNLGEDKQTIISYAVKVTKHAWNLEEMIRAVIFPLEVFDISLPWLEMLAYVVLCLERSMFIPLLLLWTPLLLSSDQGRIHRTLYSLYSWGLLSKILIFLPWKLCSFCYSPVSLLWKNMFWLDSPSLSWMVAACQVYNLTILRQLRRLRTMLLIPFYCFLLILTAAL